MLVHHADAVVDGVARAEAADLLTADGDAAARRGVDAVENVHQRRFPRAVFADKGEDLTLSDVQRDVVIRQNAGERHADMAELHGDVVQIGFPLPPGSSRDHVTKAWRSATPQTVKKPAQPKVSEGRKV